MRSRLNVVACTCVVEPRSEVHNEAHLASDGNYMADYALAVHRLAGTRRWHEVLYFPHSVGHEEARD